jgi:hypothetical protein
MIPLEESKKLVTKKFKLTFEDDDDDSDDNETSCIRFKKRTKCI